VTVAGANQLNQFLNTPRNAATKAAHDFAGCPSNDAQQLYNQLKAQRAQAEQIRNAARQENQAVQAARQTCLNRTGNSPLCNGAYSGLPFAGQEAAAQGVMNADDAALTALRALKCMTGCGQYAKVSVPSVTVGAPEKIKVTGAQFDVCTHFGGGSFSAKFEGDASVSGGGTASTTGARAGGRMTAGGQMSVAVDAPKCDQTQTITVPPPGYCELKIDVLLPQLKNLKIVPPDVAPSSLQINVPSKPVKYISGVNVGSCEESVKVCTAASAGATIRLGDNPRAIAQCTQTANAGCAKPLFGLHPETSTVDVPDPANATVSWSGGTISPGSAKVDLTRGDLKVSCGMKDVYVWKPGPVTIGHRDVQTQLCLAPRFGNVVGNQ
jgi:hypothetical protein